MPDLRPLFSPDSVAIIGAAGDTHTLRGRTTEFLIAHGYPGRIYPVTRSQPEVFGLRSYATVAELPEAPDLAVVVVPAAYVAPTLEECGKKGVRAAVIISSGFAEERGEAAQARDAGIAPGHRALRDHRLRPQFRRHRQPAEAARRDLQPGVPRPEAEPLPAEQQEPGNRGQLSERRFDLRVLEPRPAPAVAFYLPGQRRQPDLPGSARLPRLADRFRRRRYLHRLSRKHPKPGALPRRRRKGSGGQEADDPRQGRPLRGGPARRGLAYRLLGEFRSDRRCDLPPSRHHPRRRPRSCARHRRRLCLLQIAEGQPRRGDHRLGRQRGVDVRHSVGPRARTSRARRASAAAPDGAAAVLRLGAEPGRRHRAGDPRSRLRQARRDRARVAAYRHDPVDRLARQ